MSFFSPFCTLFKCIITELRCGWRDFFSHSHWSVVSRGIPRPSGRSEASTLPRRVTWRSAVPRPCRLPRRPWTRPWPNSASATRGYSTLHRNSFTAPTSTAGRKCQQTWTTWWPAGITAAKNHMPIWQRSFLRVSWRSTVQSTSRTYQIFTRNCFFKFSSCK